MLNNIIFVPEINLQALRMATKKTRGEQQVEDFDLVFKALAHESRRTILTTLQARGGTLKAGDIVEHYSYAWATMTRHLQQLEEAGLISVEKISREQHYTLNKERLTATVNEWLKWFN